MAAGWIRVADVETLRPEGARLHVQIQERHVTLLRHNGQLFCIDSICYHAGGPLGIGDIEDVDGQTCIKCPWHNYLVTLDNGEKLYKAVSFDKGKMIQGDWTSSGRKQRTHKVEDREDGIYVAVDGDEGYLESDDYAEDADAARRLNLAAA